MSVKLGTTLSPRESGDFIAEHSDHVSIIEDGIKSVAKMVSNFFHIALFAWGWSDM